jgi:aspartyl-tRNA(Asn)/glutamyl-tRNA(Gln) amidotransferase subunit C
MSKHDLSKEDVLHLAKLSALKLTDEEVEKYREQIGETLDYVKNLEELDTKDVKETHHTVNVENFFFEDGEKSERTFSQEEATANSKSKKDGAFVVKRIL